MLAELETETKGVADAMQQVDVGLGDVDHTGDQLRGIASDTSNLVGTVDQITHHSKAQSAATSDVLFGVDAAVMSGEQLQEALDRVAAFVDGLDHHVTPSEPGHIANDQGEAAWPSSGTNDS